ncbi:MAG: aspartyl protease family protein [Candidatus Geothermarchaeales archaeon]
MPSSTTSRIPCYLKKWIVDKPFPHILFTLRYSRYLGVIEAIVDTGSPYTVISTKDALRLNIPIKRMRTGGSVGLAGRSFRRPKIRDVTLRFTTDEGKPHIIKLQEMVVLKPTQWNKKVIKEVQDIPSLIGIDFLEEQGFAFHYDPKN